MQQAPDGKITLEADDTLFIYITGGFAGGVGDPVFIRLREIPELFETVRALVGKLSSSEINTLEPDNKISNEQFVVQVGPRDAIVKEMTLAFNGATHGARRAVRKLHENIQTLFQGPRRKLLRPVYTREDHQPL